MKTAGAVALLAALLGSQDPATPKPTAEFKLVIEGDKAPWTFMIEGTTTLPDGAHLKGRLYAVEMVDDFRGGKRVDEESLIHETRGFRLFTVKGGKFREKLLAAPRKPYSIWYRARLTYDPDVQDNPILDKAGEKELSWDADLKVGTPQDLDREIAATLKDLTREIDEVQTLYRDLKGKFQIWTRAPDVAAFEAWRKGLAAKSDAIRNNNDTRWSIWAIWIERQAKFRFEQFCNRFDLLCGQFEEVLAVKKKIGELSKDPGKHEGEIKELKEQEQEYELGVMYGLAGFLGYLEEAREALGIDTPADPDAVGAILKEYEAAMGELSALSAKKDAAAWKSDAPAARTRSRRALMRLTAPGLLPRRAYDRVLELSDKSTELYAVLARIAGGEKVEPGATAAEHAALVAEFRKYAGVP